MDWNESKAAAASIILTQSSHAVLIRGCAMSLGRKTGGQLLKKESVAHNDKIGVLDFHWTVFALGARIPTFTSVWNG